MPRGLLLTQLEMGKIQAFHESGDSIRVIANKINRSSNCSQFHQIGRKLWQIEVIRTSNKSQ